MAKSDNEKINRQKIIDTAGLLIAKYGRAEITLAEIANELGVTHAAIYKHYKNKKDLWESVSKQWFNDTIISQLTVIDEGHAQTDRLHQLLWSFVDAKKNAYNQNEVMFDLNTRYVETNPFVLREILMVMYEKINVIMGWPNDDFQKAELIMSAFTVFTLPTFRDTWNQPDFQTRFEDMWALVLPGIQAQVVTQ